MPSAAKDLPHQGSCPNLLALRFRLRDPLIDEKHHHPQVQQPEEEADEMAEQEHELETGLVQEEPLFVQEAEEVGIVA